MFLSAKGVSVSRGAELSAVVVFLYDDFRHEAFACQYAPPTEIVFLESAVYAVKRNLVVSLIFDKEKWLWLVIRVI